MASSSWAGYGPAAPTQGPSSAHLQRSASGDRQKKPQSRQLLSCTKCRERKVKCDRTKPCSACCARGHPKECEFVVGEGNDYSPIQQSYEIRKLRAENQRLKERLQQARLTGSGDDDDDGDSSDRKGSRTTSRAAASRQRRFKTGERVDNLYFGTPGLANIVHDFANLQVGSQSLTHTVPRGRDMYLPPDGPSAYPFPIMQGGNSAAELARGLLRSHDLVYETVDIFQRRAQSCYFPHTPDEVTKREVERFLSDAEGNAEKYPDMLALIFATMATGMQMGVYDRHGGWVAGAVEDTRRTSDVYLAAAKQALRLASYLNSPTLLGIQTLIMMGPYLTNSGRFLDAWTLFGTTIRMAHSIGLHRDPKFLDPAPPLRECSIRRTLWWWMLHMDQQYSVTLGRPLGISGFGDCPAPEPLTTNPTILRLGEFVDHFTILARQILSSDGMMNVSRIDEFTDKLVGLWDTMPEALQFNESWVQPDKILPEWPLEVMSAMLFSKVQSFLILLNRQRVERTQATPGDHSPPGHMMPPPRPQQMSNSLPYGEHAAPVRGRRLVINSCAQLLQAFMFFYHRNPAVLICWTMGQQAFNACMILILHAWETEEEHHQWLVENAFVAFSELQNNGVHRLAEVAVRRISDGLAMLGQRKQQREQQAAMSRRQPGYHPQLQIDTASMTDFSNDAVMGNTGMFLLEDPGLQSYTAPVFQPLGWHMAGGSAHPSNSSNPTTPNIPSPIVPVSLVTAAPFPVMCSPPFMSPIVSRVDVLPPSYGTAPPIAQAAFTPINTATGVPLAPAPRGEEPQSFSRVRGPPHGHSHHRQAPGSGPRGINQHSHQHQHRPARSQQRRK
ncbi:transcriptional regulatory [Lecanosticta acicola]|uniref:Transcriptional regulatory n=1 Tax=Lecanosticta acicola TaxID=111012 RepID=A0AAI8Z3I1_9PEZI|nr:transcriptional regulatory [Lecanosticta acicola]